MLWLMFAAYNERENLVNLLPGLSSFLEDKIKDYKILIVDDGSTDSTKNIADSLDKPIPIEIISHEKNKGVGEVFKTGFSAISCLAGQDDLVVVLEADGTSDYTLIPELVRKLEGGMDIVIASRYIKGGAYRNFPLKRHLISRIGNVILSMAFRNKRIKDYTIFFRGYRVELLKKVLLQYKDGFITSNTFLANKEALINLTKLTDKIDEVPFVYSYEVKIGKSKIPLLKTFFDYIKFLLCQAR